MTYVIWIFLGGGLGAVSRYVAGQMALRWFGADYPYGTLLVNVLGSFLMGLAMAWLVKRSGSTEIRLFLATGFLGGFTTFSTFSLDVATLWERGASSGAFIYALASVIMCVTAVFLGLWLMRLWAS